MTSDKTANTITLRERLKERHREWAASRKAALAKDPRIQAMKQTLKDRVRAAYERSKVYRKGMALE